MGDLKWPKRIVIVRHGYSQMNEAHDIANLLSEDKQPVDLLGNTRDMDVPLTKEGHRQASETGKLLAKEHAFDIAFSSPYKRCVDTLRYILAQFNDPVRVFMDSRLRERETGWMYGMTAGVIKAKFPDEAGRRNRDGRYWYRPPGGENFPAVEQRVHSFLDKLHRDHAGQNVLVATHGITYLLFRALFEHLGEKELMQIDTENPVPNCGMQVYEIDTSKYPEGRMKLKEYNNTAYSKK